MIGLSLRRSAAAAFGFLALLALPAVPSLQAQTDVPAAPAQSAEVVGPTFPKPDPADFTADSPTKEQVNAFLQASWGYDSNRVYQVQRIAKTVVPGISNVVIYAGEKGRREPGVLQFFVLPDGKHIISAGEILPFGPHPFAENREILMKRADGPSRGATDKTFQIVEFADFQCPHCKDAQPTIEKIVTDFPNVRFVFQSFPLPQHAQAFRAAAYGVCVAKLGGNKAFFDYDAAVYDGQAGLSSDDSATLTLNSAVSKAGQDPEKIEACSKTPETKASVEAGIKLAQDLNVNQTPYLFIDGRGIPLGGVSYDVVKQMISYHLANSATK